uniref:Uncharacterized protein n=1 Tax=Romanomermis culicivorax TaxID=13658 RepID=A0A915HTS6_ROMCU
MNKKTKRMKGQQKRRNKEEKEMREEAKVEITCPSAIHICIGRLDYIHFPMFSDTRHVDGSEIVVVVVVRGMPRNE